MVSRVWVGLFWQLMAIRGLVQDSGQERGECQPQPFFSRVGFWVPQTPFTWHLHGKKVNR